MNARTLLVLQGRDGARFTRSESKAAQAGHPGHKLWPVYRHMLASCVLWVPALPDPRTLTMAEIRFFYDVIRAQLVRATRP